jgi:hypothetical protein
VNAGDVARLHGFEEFKGSFAAISSSGYLADDMRRFKNEQEFILHAVSRYAIPSVNHIVTPDSDLKYEYWRAFKLEDFLVNSRLLGRLESLRDTDEGRLPICFREVEYALLHIMTFFLEGPDAAW